MGRVMEYVVSSRSTPLNFSFWDGVQVKAICRTGDLAMISCEPSVAEQIEKAHPEWVISVHKKAEPCSEDKK